jgi:hypothetical protein
MAEISSKEEIYNSVGKQWIKIQVLKGSYKIMRKA